MTNQQPTTAQPAGSWKSFQETLKPALNGERHPFFPLAQLPAGSHVDLQLTTNPEFDPARFHGQYSKLEFDAIQRSGTDKGKPFRVCVSGARLAVALAAVEPMAGMTVRLQPTGDGKNRTWAASVV